MTFQDLKFRPHPYAPFGAQAVVMYHNGYGLSVVTGDRMFQCGPDTYEVAVLHNYRLCYTTPLADGVLGYQTPGDVTALMERVSQLSEVG